MVEEGAASSSHLRYIIIFKLIGRTGDLQNCTSMSKNGDEWQNFSDVFFSFCPLLSLGWDSGYSHMRKQSVENVQDLTGPVYPICCPHLAVSAERSGFSLGVVIFGICKVSPCVCKTLLYVRESSITDRGEAASGC